MCAVCEQQSNDSSAFVDESLRQNVGRSARLLMAAATIARRCGGGFQTRDSETSYTESNYAHITHTHTCVSVAA